MERFGETVGKDLENWHFISDAREEDIELMLVTEGHPALPSGVPHPSLGRVAAGKTRLYRSASFLSSDLPAFSLLEKLIRWMASLKFYP